MVGRGKGGKAKSGGKEKSRSSRAGLQFPVGRRLNINAVLLPKKTAGDKE